jgi:hypothetical protein
MSSPVLLRELVGSMTESDMKGFSVSGDGADLTASTMSLDE